MSNNYPIPYNFNQVTPFIWAERFALYLCTQREDICPLEAYKLGYDYIEMLPNLIRVDPVEVVETYLEGC